VTKKSEQRKNGRVREITEGRASWARLGLEDKKVKTVWEVKKGERRLEEKVLQMKIKEGIDQSAGKTNPDGGEPRG